MNEFEVIVIPKAGSIETNFSDIKAQLELEMSAYVGIKVDEENQAERKKDVAFLRKVRKAVDDRRKDVKKSYMQPYTEFEDSCKELLGIIDKPIDEINSQLKEFDEKRIADKKAELEQLYKDNIEDYSRFIPFESTLDDSWSNVSYKTKDYLYRLSEMKIHVRSDLDCIRGLASEIEDELITVYQKTGNNLSSAVARNTQYLSDKERVREQVKEEVKATSQKPDIPFEKPAPIKQFEDLQNKINMVHFVVSAEDADAVEQFLQFSEITYRKE